MDAASSTNISLFGGFRLDRRSGVLCRRDERSVFAPLSMGSRALEILGVLVERPGELVSRGEIMAAVWPGTAVEDSNLNVQIAALRRVLERGERRGAVSRRCEGAAIALPRRWRGSRQRRAPMPRHFSKATRLRCPISRRWR